MEGAAAAAATRRLHMATLPAQVIKVERAPRGSRFETIPEEEVESSHVDVMSWDEECAANVVAFGAAVAPAAVITVTRAAFRSGLEPIWEETMRLMVAEYFAAEAARRHSQISVVAASQLGNESPKSVFC